jgi:hypothetical protein
MALQLHVLAASDSTAPYLELTVAYWIDVPAALQSRFANPSATSRVPWASSTELAAIRAGQVLEVVETVRWSDPPDDATILAALKARVRTLLLQKAAELGVPLPQATPRFWRDRLRYDASTDTWQVVA